MNKLLITLISLIISTTATAGCIAPDGSTKPLGYIYNVDEHHPQRIIDEQAFVEKHGVVPDGGRYKIAVCSFEVNLKEQDYPAKADRRYHWMAISLAPSYFSEKYIPSSYKDK